VERILTAVTSLRQQGREAMEYLTQACQVVTSEMMSESLIPNSS
jgi:hypothetical protein